MQTVKEDVLSRIHETNILLNSNMLDGLNAAKEAKSVTQEVLISLEALEKGTEKNSDLVRSELTTQIKKLKKDVNEEINKLTDSSLQSITKTSDELKFTSKTLTDIIQKNLQDIKLRQDLQFQALENVLTQQNREQRELILLVQNNLFAQIDVSFANQEKLSNKLSNLKNILTNFQEAQFKKLDEENQKSKKYQKKWYIALIIAILIGYLL